MDIAKEAALQQGGMPTPAQMQRINQQAKSPLQPEQVYVFSVRLCDDQPDRDFERFDPAALPVLAQMFLGKTGICDHEWSAERQLARIFDTAVEHDGQTTYLRAWAYMLRTEKNEEIIQEIEGGIRREVSVGCSVGLAKCSVCGAVYGECGHEKGQVYEGHTCYRVLCDPKDAYEFSFVAVPAQPAAGVMKAKGCTLEQMVQKTGTAAQQTELQQLQQEAALGKRYLDTLRRDIVRLALTLEVDAQDQTLRSIAAKLDEEELLAMQAALEKKAAAQFPAATQLPGSRPAPVKISTDDYLI